MLKKLKKGLKKAAKGVAKVGIPVGAAILAAKAMKKDKGALTADMDRSMVPMNKRMVQGLNFPADTDLSGIDKLAAAGGADKMMAKGGRVTKSRGAGIAKRGFGRAFKGGRK